MYSAVVSVLACRSAGPTLPAPTGPFDRLPPGDSCLQVHPHLVPLQHRDMTARASRASYLAWTEGVSDWYEVRWHNAWRAEAVLTVPFEEFVENTHAELVSEPWNGACDARCSRPRVWRIGPRRAGIGTYSWPRSTEGTRCDVQPDVVEEAKLYSRREVTTYRVDVTEHELVMSRQGPDNDHGRSAGLSRNPREESRDGETWVVSRIRFDDLALEESDAEFREAAAEERNRVRLPVDQVPVGTGTTERQLVLWRLEVERNPAARADFARLVSRILASRNGPYLLTRCAYNCVMHGCAHIVLPYLDAHVSRPDDDYVSELRRWAIRNVDTARLPEVLEQDGILGDGEEAAAMLQQVERYDFGEEAWLVHQKLHTADMQAATGSLPMETLVETLVALVGGSPAPWAQSLYFRVDMEPEALANEELTSEPLIPHAVRPSPDHPNASWRIANPPLRIVTWLEASAAHQVWLVPPYRDISEAGESWRRIRGRVTLSVAVGDQQISPQPREVLSIRGRVDGDDFRLEASSAPFDWAVVSRLVSATLATFPLAPYARASRRPPPGQYRAQVTAAEQAAITARARAVQSIRCSGDDPEEFTCVMPSNRLAARRAMMQVLRPLLFE